MATTKEKERSAVRAQAKWVRGSARKARLVLDTIRGRNVPEARTVLAFSTRAVARDIDKVLRSAVANAETNHDQFGDEMVISACYADEGPRLKRWKPRARGRADRFIKQTCHITIELTTFESESAPGRPSRPVAIVETPKPAAPAPPAAAPAPAVEPPTEAAAATEPVAESAAPTEKPKTTRKRAAKPSAKKAEKGETEKGDAKPKASSNKRKPRAKKAEE